MKIEDFFGTEPAPAAALKAIKRLLKSGALFRYIQKREEGEVALLEQEFAKELGVKYALALNSCSSAMFLSLVASGVKPGDRVLIPAFTFGAVPSAVVHAGAIPVLVECTDRYRIDIDDLRLKAKSGAQAFILSHMRGHTSDMDQIMSICKENDMVLIEDAAHSLGVQWSGKYVGTYGATGCFSFQSYKLVNGGEGGMLITDNDDIAARAILLSGAYEKNWERHFNTSEISKKYQDTLPLFNLRMSNLSAAVIRPQIHLIQARASKGRALHARAVSSLEKSRHFEIPKPYEKETTAPDSIQFNLISFTDAEAKDFMLLTRERGVSLYVLGLHDGNARVFWNWKFLKEVPELPRTRAMLMRACDVRLPLSFSPKKVDEAMKIIIEAADEVRNRHV